MSRRRQNTSVNVLGRKYRVARVNRDGQSGAMYPFDGLIEVAPGMDDYSTKDTFLHEVMHAILYQQGRGTGGSDDEQYKEEESYVKPLATGLIAFFRANPGVANWLIADPEALG